MFLLKFHYEDKNYLLHDGDYFIGGSSKWIAETRRLENASKCRAVGNMEVVEIPQEELEKIVIKYPFPITSFTGGEVSFCGVEIKSGEKDEL